MPEIIIKVKKNEAKVFPIIWLGEANADIKLTAILDQPGSSLKILGVFFGKSGHLNLETSIIHRAPNTFSRTTIRGVLDGTASTHFEGKVLIEKDAKNSDGDLKGHAILLSKQARAILIPQLEVLENQVKAGHGATVGKIDEEQLFYIMSRGLSLDEAKHIIIKGFLGALVEEFPKKERLKVVKALSL